MDAKKEMDLYVEQLKSSFGISKINNLEELIRCVNYMGGRLELKDHMIHSSEVINGPDGFSIHLWTPIMMNNPDLAKQEILRSLAKVYLNKKHVTHNRAWEKAKVSMGEGLINSVQNSVVGEFLFVDSFLDKNMQLSLKKR